MQTMIDFYGQSELSVTDLTMYFWYDCAALLTRGYNHLCHYGVKYITTR